MSITTIPNLHIFELQEVVDYRQLNGNFSEINNHMLHYVEATVTAYNTATFETTVSYNNNTFITLINRTGNILTVGDSVYIYYWEDMESDGYIGLKLGLPNIQGGDSVTIGEYLNSSSNSLRLNDLSTNTKIEIEDTNNNANFLVSDSKIFFEKLLPSGSIYGTPFSDSSIIGTRINLYDVVCTRSQIFGDGIQINNYSSYDSGTDTYTFKSLHVMDNATIVGQSINIYDYRTTFDNYHLITVGDCIIAGKGISISLYDGPNYDQGIYYSSIFGISHTITKSLFRNSSMIGKQNTVSNVRVDDTDIFGYQNTIQSNDSSGLPILDNHIFGCNNTITHSLNYSTCFINGKGNSFSNCNSNGAGVKCERVYVEGYNNTLSDVFMLGSFISGMSNTIKTATPNNSGACVNDSVRGTNNSINFGSYSMNSTLIGVSNNINYGTSMTGNMSDFSLFGNSNTISTYYRSYYNNISHSLLIGDLNIIGGSDTTHYDSIDSSIICGIHTVIGTSKVTELSSSGIFGGKDNTIDGKLYNSMLIGNSNTINANVSGSLISGDTNTVSNTVLYNTGIIYDNTVLGNNNTISASDSGDPNGLIQSTILGGNNEVIYDLAHNYTTSCNPGYHTVVGNHGSIKYSTNADAHKIKMVLAIETLYDSSVANSNGNAVTIDYQGNMNVVGTVTSAGADFAEYWEWQDGNVNDEDRRGLFVTLAENGYVKIANSGDKILGIVSAKPTITGGDDNWEWHDKYLKDVFGEYIYEEIEEPVYEEQQQLVTEAYTDEENVFHEAEYETVQVVVDTNTVRRRKLNPNYDPEQVYTNRKYRKEYVQIAHLGKLVMVDDGNCETGDYLTTLDNGIATKSETFTKFVCIKRIDENHIYVLADYFN